LFFFLRLFRIINQKADRGRPPGLLFYNPLGFDPNVSRGAGAILNHDLEASGFNFISNFCREALVGKNGKRGLQRRDLKCTQFVEFAAVDQYIDMLAAPKQFRE
jgi:hypothetical protein